jgi:hypothetical protein
MNIDGPVSDSNSFNNRFESFLARVHWLRRNEAGSTFDEFANAFFRFAGVAESAELIARVKEAIPQSKAGSVRGDRVFGLKLTRPGEQPQLCPPDIEERAAENPPSWWTQPIPPSPQPRTANGQATGGYRQTTGKYGMAALDDECLKVRHTGHGDRNNQLNRSAFRIAQLISGGSVDAKLAWDRLYEAARSCGLEDREITDVINRAMAAGVQQPRQPEPRTAGSAPSGSGQQYTAGPSPSSSSPSGQPGVGAEEPIIIPLASVETKDVKWQWNNRIPYGAVTLFDGDPDQGKTAILIDLAARASRGSAMPGETAPRVPVNVLLMNGEDDLERTIKPRLLAAGADLDRISYFDAVRCGNYIREVVFPDDLGLLESVVRTKDIGFMAGDPLAAFLGEDVNSHNDAQIRRVLRQVARVVQRTQAAFAANRHFNKMSNVSDPMYRGGGSIGIIAAVRSAFLIAPHPDEEDVKVLAPIKTNLCAKPPSLRYRLVFGSDGLKVEWLRGTCPLTAKELLSRQRRHDQEERDQFTVQDAGSAILMALDANDPDRKGIHAPDLQDLARLSDRDFICAVADLKRQNVIEEFGVSYWCGKNHSVEKKKPYIRRPPSQS